MNPFQRARDKAIAVRRELAGSAADEPLEASSLLQAVEDTLNIGIDSVAPSYADLGGGIAVLQREQRFIYVSNEHQKWAAEFCALVAHELGHWYLDPESARVSVSSLSSLYAPSTGPAIAKVEAYGARERQELQANVFARELLLPRDIARRMWMSGITARQASTQVGIPIEHVRQQMLDAVLLPPSHPQPSATITPSEDQLQAATATGRAANVVAGPGTGKTSTLIHRIKHLVQELKVEPSSILALTFTNKAALELSERLYAAGIDRAADVWAGTFHAFGLEFLRKYHHQFGLSADLRVADSLNVLTLMVRSLPRVELGYFLRVEDPYDWLMPVLNAIKRLKEELVDPASYRRFITSTPHPDPEVQLQRLDVASLYELHEAVLLEQQTIDFVDLIAKPAIALKAKRLEFMELAARFDYILVDEYQDVTQAMVELLRQLARGASSLWVVGDVRQAIHHWRGASLKSLLHFESEFRAHAGQTRIQRFALGVNRRSSSEVLDFVHHVGRDHALQGRLPLDEVKAEKGSSGHRPELVTCSERGHIAAAICAKVTELRQDGVSYGQQAVLCRKSGDVLTASQALRDAGIPVVYIGELAQRTEIKRILCLMQLLVERQPRALLGLASTPNLAMPAADFWLLMDACKSNASLQRGRWLAQLPEGISAQGRTVASRLAALLGGATRRSAPWEFVCDVLLEHGFGVPEDEEDSVDAWVQRIALWQFAYSVRNGDGDMREARLSRFLLRYRLRQRVGEAYVERELPPEAAELDGVRMLTVHASKGLEFDAVHVGYVEAGAFGEGKPAWPASDELLELVPPESLGSSQAEYDDESAVERNNLLYVAASRARKRLVLYQSNQFRDSVTHQLEDTSKTCESSIFTAPTTRPDKPATAARFTPAESLRLEDFDTYVTCPLQYWYRRVAQLPSEDELDVSLRARMAVMATLHDVATAMTGSAGELFKSNWDAQGLPSKEEDPYLWRDAIAACRRGLTVTRQELEGGAKAAALASTVAGLRIQLPWGFLGGKSTPRTLRLLRFRRPGVGRLRTLLKPIVNGIQGEQASAMSLCYVLSEHVDSVDGATRVAQTKSFQAAKQFLAGEVRPQPGGHCTRCAFMTICPSLPDLHHAHH